MRGRETVAVGEGAESCRAVRGSAGSSVNSSRSTGGEAGGRQQPGVVPGEYRAAQPLGHHAQDQVVVDGFIDDAGADVVGLAQQVYVVAGVRALERGDQAEAVQVVELYIFLFRQRVPGGHDKAGAFGMNRLGEYALRLLRRDRRRADGKVHPPFLQCADQIRAIHIFPRDAAARKLLHISQRQIRAIGG